MREQLKLLEQLQKVDLEITEYTQSLTSLPAKLRSLKEDVQRVETMLQAEQDQLTEAQRYRRELDQIIKLNQDQQNKSKVKLAQIRNNKELLATQRELETSRKSGQEREEELTKLETAIKDSEDKVRAHEADLQALKAIADEEERQTETKLKELRQKIEQNRTKRRGMTSGIDKDLLRRYETIQKRRGNAVVPARHGVCTGCNMHLPPQLFNTLQAETSIEHCPSCQRIVYFVSEDGRTEGPGGK